MRIIGRDDRFTPVAALLLSAVSEVSAQAIQRVTIVPSNTHWLRLPWYRQGGAMLLGERIHVSSSLLSADADQGALLRLLAHEVGHLAHSAPFGTRRSGRLRFFVWAAGHYARSSVMHASDGYRRSRIEQEAERGRWVLGELMRGSGCAMDKLPNDPAEMADWLRSKGVLLAALHKAYSEKVDAVN